MAYEATLCSAILNSQDNGNKRVFLTLLGGGAFGNRSEWIMDSLKRALALYKEWNLDVTIVSYKRSNPDIQKLVKDYSTG